MSAWAFLSIFYGAWFALGFIAVRARWESLVVAWCASTAAGVLVFGPVAAVLGIYQLVR